MIYKLMFDNTIDSATQVRLSNFNFFKQFLRLSNTEEIVSNQCLQLGI